VRLWEVAEELLARGTMSWRGVLLHAFGAFLPPSFWRRLTRSHGGYAGVTNYTAIRADRLEALDLRRLAAERELDFSYRPRKDGFGTRLWVLRRDDLGNYNKGTLAGWGIDQRDPTADRRLIEYCLSVPMDEYLHKGQLRSLGRRALSGRLPEAVLDAPHKGYQAVDWHEGLTAARTDIAAEVERLAPCESATQMLDVDRMHGLVAKMPDSGWERPDVMRVYRLALLRGISAGHFLRRAAGSNQ
jgi:asparagine synthase (glutamine-hydrolysing)